MLTFLSHRIVNLGNPRKPLLIPEPELTAQLPCTDEVWDKDGGRPVPSSLSSPPELLGRYAGLAQACYLLGCVLRFVSSKSTRADDSAAEIEQLDKTLHALVRYSESNAGINIHTVCYQTAISFWQVPVYLPLFMEFHGNLYQRTRNLICTVPSAESILLVPRASRRGNKQRRSYGIPGRR